MKQHEAEAFRKRIDDHENSCPEWSAGVWVEADKNTVFRNGYVYICRQSHTTQVGYEPENVPALWTKVPKDWEEWEQPLGSEDSYRIGAKVTHEGKRWVNESDYNIYAPGVFGWAEVT